MVPLSLVRIFAVGIIRLQAVHSRTVNFDFYNSIDFAVADGGGGGIDRQFSRNRCGTRAAFIHTEKIITISFGRVITLK